MHIPDQPSQLLSTLCRNHSTAWSGAGHWLGQRAAIPTATAKLQGPSSLQTLICLKPGMHVGQRIVPLGQSCYSHKFAGLS